MISFSALYGMGLLRFLNTKAPTTLSQRYLYSELRFHSPRHLLDLHTCTRVPRSSTHIVSCHSPSSYTLSRRLCLSMRSYALLGPSYRLSKTCGEQRPLSSLNRTPKPTLVQPYKPTNHLPVRSSPCTRRDPTRLRLPRTTPSDFPNRDNKLSKG
ncbi:hypothetical protein CC2G_001369 [Coprinopsis cinerea AmutBmut pab1-1]|nr:hypothetical protein CC2G_001369 [Coprinopsis cinerea AmutBmut pab1-1]